MRALIVASLVIAIGTSAAFVDEYVHGYVQRDGTSVQDI